VDLVLIWSSHGVTPVNVTRIRLDKLTVDELREMERILEKAGVSLLAPEAPATSSQHALRAAGHS
jgi:hypothetical protein